MFLFQSKGEKAWQLSHVVNNSWLPLAMSVGTFFMMTSIVYTMLTKKISLVIISVSFLMITFIMYIWQRDIVRESVFQGNHSFLVQSGLKWGLIWFLFSEIWFFFSIFWSFFHFSISPLTSGLFIWPLFGSEVVPAFQVPLLNTIILVMSGVTSTLGHQDILSGRKSDWVLFSGVLGAYFMSLQGMEYYSGCFSLASGSFGSIFFFGTGFHGMHVTLGFLMLMVSFFRIKYSQVSMYHHFGLEFSLWYWHFVDVVWLFLFAFFYVWSSV